MKVTIDIWQSKINGDWCCYIKSSDSEGGISRAWPVDNFCDLLTFLADRFPTVRINRD